jgi:hypothetical protein
VNRFLSVGGLFPFGEIVLGNIPVVNSAMISPLDCATLCHIIAPLYAV